MATRNPKKSILCLIDNNPEDRAMIRRYLLQDTNYHYSILEAETGEEGLALCKSAKPDCILLDYDLPGLDGLAVLNALTGDDGTVPYAVIMLTDQGNEAIAQQATQHGAQDYLVKGEMTAGNLLRAIHNAIERTMMRQIMEQQHRNLAQRNQEIQAFAYALAHDLRAPLRAIGGFAQIVEQDYRTQLDENGLRYIQRIIQSSRQMDRLIDELLSYTRLEHRTLRRKPVDLTYVVQQVLEQLAERIAATAASIIVPTSLPVIYSDQTLIQQIILNLVSNALLYHRPGNAPRVELQCILQHQDCLLAVSDNGIGIAAAYQERIFQVFQRLHSEDEYPGTGIGLAIVKKAVDMMGGQVWFESIVGQGSTFYVKLPSVAESA
jgi:light-regulated signal transduction histidine kinase (bacteriophytochrome)